MFASVGVARNYAKRTKLSGRHKMHSMRVELSSEIQGRKIVDCNYDNNCLCVLSEPFLDEDIRFFN